MMYLGIFVFAVLTTSSFGLNDKEWGDGPFSCPSCQGNSLKACDDNIENEECEDWDEPVCVLGRITNTKWKTQTYERYCYSREDYNDLKDYCDSNPAACTMAMCDQSGCYAELANSAEQEPTGQFMCPVCSAGGKNADSKCEGNIENEPCLVADPVCSLTVSTASSFMKFRIRDCRSREYYTQTKDDCEQRGNCAMVMCDTSGCKAEFPASA
ncbi:uncharacterized protein LOC144665549 [Oculina patagonica]